MPKRKYTSRKQQLRRVIVRAERRKEPDWDRFAWALLQHARLLVEQAKNKTDSDDSARSP